MPDTHDKTISNPPRSEAQQAAVRRNGANSKGPTSTLGKANSSRNVLGHELTSFNLALCCEDHDSFNLVFADYMDEYRPVNATETNLVEQIAFAHWRMYRAWTAETAVLNVELSEPKQSRLLPRR